MAQETLIKASRIPYTIVRATQFFEFAGAIAQSATDGQTVRLPSALVQPIASDDVAAVMADVAGPESIPLDEFVRRFLKANGDAKEVIPDVRAHYFGLELNDRSLTPGDSSRIGSTWFEDWLSRSIAQK